MGGYIRELSRVENIIVSTTMSLSCNGPVNAHGKLCSIVKVTLCDFTPILYSTVPGYFSIWEYDCPCPKYILQLLAVTQYSQYFGAVKNFNPECYTVVTVQYYISIGKAAMNARRYWKVREDVCGTVATSTNSAVNRLCAINNKVPNCQ